MKKEIIITVVASIFFFLIGFSLFGLNENSTSSSSAQTSTASAFDMESIKNGDYIVKTDEPNALPVLTEEQLKTACECLKDEQKENALKYIKDVKKVEENYKVNAVFALAVFRKENGIATDYTGILKDNTYNIGSITTKSSDPKSIKVTGSDGKERYFKIYDSFEEGIDDFGKYLANHSEYYFSHNEYTIDKIAEHYCNADWAKIVKGYVNDFYEAANVELANNTDSSINSNIDNAEVKEIMNWSDSQAWKAITGTAYSSKPRAGQVSQSTMDSRMKTITVKIRDGENSTKNQNMTVNKAIAPLWEAFFNDLYEQCPDFYIKYDGCYVYRANTSGSSMSAHAFGCAIDINASTPGNGYHEKPYTKEKWEKLTDKNVKHRTIYFNSPMLKIAHKYTLVNGADWSNPNDAMHTSFIGDWSRQQAKSKFGK